MSRTAAHAPFPVRLARGDLAAYEVHDHRFALVCDLPARPQSWRAPLTRCQWEFFDTGIGSCPCAMCHGGPYHRRDRRRDRHATRASLRRWVDAAQ